MIADCVQYILFGCKTQLVKLPTIWAVLSTTVGIRVAALLFKSAGPPFPHGAISTKCECVVCLPNMMDPSRGTWVKRRYMIFFHTARREYGYEIIDSSVTDLLDLNQRSNKNAKMQPGRAACTFYNTHD